MFHVPNQFRLRQGRLASTDEAGNNGVFLLKEKPVMAKRHNGAPRTLVIIASDGGGWEHISIHVEKADGKTSTPFWEDMQQMKDLFWDETDCVIQYHPAKKDYVNVHPNTLHLWRFACDGGWEDFLPMPPKEFV
jgi:hypothetical protein